MDDTERDQAEWDRAREPAGSPAHLGLVVRRGRDVLEVAGSDMPTVLRIGAARFFFFSDEGREPPHIHVEQSGSIAKFWLDPVCLVTSSRFRGRELRRLEREVVEHQRELLEAWREFFET